MQKETKADKILRLLFFCETWGFLVVNYSACGNQQDIAVISGARLIYPTCESGPQLNY